MFLTPGAVRFLKTIVEVTIAPRIVVGVAGVLKAQGHGGVVSGATVGWRDEIGWIGRGVPIYCTVVAEYAAVIGWAALPVWYEIISCRNEPSLDVISAQYTVLGRALTTTLTRCLGDQLPKGYT